MGDAELGLAVSWLRAAYARTLGERSGGRLNSSFLLSSRMHDRQRIAAGSGATRGVLSDRGPFGAVSGGAAQPSFLNLGARTQRANSIAGAHVHELLKHPLILDDRV